MPRFDKLNAKALVEKQLSFGTRVPGSEGHKACGDWIVETLESYGAEVIEQPFDAKVYTGATLASRNIIGQFNPAATKRVLLCAHWDTRHIADWDDDRTNEPIMGADDAGSGVAVLLEIGRILQETPIELGVDMVFFDAEDHGEQQGDEKTWCIGSQYWSNNLHTPGYKAKYGILFDMVGAKGARFAKEGTSMNYAPAIMNKVWSIAHQKGYGDYFVMENDPPVIDDHYFVNPITKIPTIDIINRRKQGETQSGFASHWHTHEDDIDIIDANTLRAAGQVALEVLYRENAGQF